MLMCLIFLRFQRRHPAASVTNTQQRKQCKFCCVFLLHTSATPDARKNARSEQKIQKYAACAVFTRGSLIGKLPYTNLRAPQIITTTTTTTTHHHNHHHHHKAQPSQLVHSLAGNAKFAFLRRFARERNAVFFSANGRFADVGFFHWSEQCSNFG